MQVYSHQVPGGMMSNLVSQLEIQNAADRLPEVMREIPKVRAEGGLSAARHAVVADRGHAGCVQRAHRQALERRVQGDEGLHLRLLRQGSGPHGQGHRGEGRGQLRNAAADVAPGSLVTTTYAQVEEEIGDLAKSEEDVLMYALFPNEARTFLSKHRTSEKVDFLMEQESRHTKEDDYVDINQIRELVRVAEESGAGEIVVEEEGTRIAVRMPGTMSAEAAAVAAAAAPVAAVAPAPAAAPAAAADDVERPSDWYAVTAPHGGHVLYLPGTRRTAVRAGGDEVAANQTLCIVEAMKLMNEIAAEEMGTVREVCLEDATPVEFGTVLFYIEPHGAPAPAPETA